MVTKKDFKAVAEIIKSESLQGKKPIDGSASVMYAIQCVGSDIAKELADYFATQNPRFDCDRFMEACGL